MAPSDKKEGANSDDTEKPPPPDWAEIYADLLCHTSMNYSEIAKRSIPQIEAIRSKLGKHIPLSMGIPGLFGGTLEKPAQQSGGKPPKLSQFMALANTFNVIK